MKCPKCGAVLEADSKFCVSCGAQLGESEDSANVDQNPIPPESSNDQQASAQSPANPTEWVTPKKLNLIELIVGTIIMVIGIVRIITAGTSISSTSFGGDFYTYTYQGIVAISEILASIEVSLGWIIAAIGAAIDVNALRHSGDSQ